MLLSIDITYKILAALGFARFASCFKNKSGFNNKSIDLPLSCHFASQNLALPPSTTFASISPRHSKLRIRVLDVLILVLSRSFIPSVLAFPCVLQLLRC